MIISLSRGFAFVKTMKVGGTSVEIALSAVVDDDDVLTPIGRADEALRLERTGRGPQHHDVDPPVRVGNRTVRQLRNHSSAADARAVVGRETWERLFTFTIERDPWDRAVSLYAFRVRNDPDPVSFRRFLLRVPESALTNAPAYSDDVGRLLVDRVLRYERLDAELAEVTDRLGLPSLDLPRAKSGFRDRVPLAELYDAELDDRIRRACGFEIDLLGYTSPLT